MSSVSIRRSGVKRLSRAPSRWALIIVQRPSDWEPTGWDDEPFSCEALWTEKAGLRLSRARGIMFGFNIASIASHGRLWAMLQPDLGTAVGTIGIVPRHNFL